jgi:hypothetical protein
MMTRITPQTEVKLASALVPAPLRLTVKQKSIYSYTFTKLAAIAGFLCLWFLVVAHPAQAAEGVMLPTFDNRSMLIIYLSTIIGFVS